LPHSSFPIEPVPSGIDCGYLATVSYRLGILGVGVADIVSHYL
jgi:hypothetical protein